MVTVAPPGFQRDRCFGSADSAGDPVPARQVQVDDRQCGAVVVLDKKEVIRAATDKRDRIARF